MIILLGAVTFYIVIHSYHYICSLTVSSHLSVFLHLKSYLDQA